MTFFKRTGQLAIGLILSGWMFLIWQPFIANAENGYVVSVGKVMQQDVHEWLHVYGRVGFDDAALQNINLAYSGQVIRLPMLAGEPVRKGQVLAEITVDPSVASSYQQALVGVGFAKSEMKRMQKMLSEQLATKSQLASAQKKLSNARSQLHQMQQKGFDKSVHIIRAEFDAVVAAYSGEVGT